MFGTNSKPRHARGFFELILAASSVRRRALEDQLKVPTDHFFNAS
jgi:hypothetical protein